MELNVLKDILGEPANDEFAAELDTQAKTSGKMTVFGNLCFKHRLQGLQFSNDMGKIHAIKCSSDMSEPKYMRNAHQPNTRMYAYAYTHIHVCIYAHTRIQYIRVCLIGMYELTYCFFFSYRPLLFSMA